MKSVLRLVYIALVGLVVFTGALFIAQGAITGEGESRASAPTPWPEAAVPPDARGGDEPFIPDGEDAPVPRQYPAPDGAAMPG